MGRVLPPVLLRRDGLPGGRRAALERRDVPGAGRELRLHRRGSRGGEGGGAALREGRRREVIPRRYSVGGGRGGRGRR